MCSPVQKLPKKHTKVKRTRVERMRRLYTQCKAPGDSSCRSVCVLPETSPHLSLCCVPLDPPTPQTGPALGPDEREHWEREMDELVEWTHSLSVKELDDLLYAHI